MKPLIGVTATPTYNERGNCRAAQLNSPYLDAVREAGGIPVMLFDGADEAETLAARLDGLLLTGGDDVDPALFGEENTASRGVDPLRDRLELACLHAFAAAGKPVLGICRGIQLMAVALGGDLWQDLPSQTATPHPFGSRHPIAVRPGSFLQPILGAETIVNSTHHQAIRRVPAGFLVSAAAPDGVLEAMETTDGRPLWGVQFHPERLLTEDPRLVALFRLLTT